MVEVMQRPYIRTAILKGMAFRRVVVRHALRNAMINPITVILLQVNYLISGVVVVVEEASGKHPAALDEPPGPDPGGHAVVQRKRHPCVR